MFIDGFFVGHDQWFFGAVGDAHDVDVAEFGATLTPVAVGHDVETADLLAGLHFAAGRNGPVKERVEFGDALAGGEGFDVFEECGEAADDTAIAERLGDAIKIKFEPVDEIPRSSNGKFRFIVSEIPPEDLF